MSIEETIPNCKVKLDVVKGIVHAVKIQDAAKEIKPQLIIIGKKSIINTLQFV